MGVSNGVANYSRRVDRGASECNRAGGMVFFVTANVWAAARTFHFELRKVAKLSVEGAEQRNSGGQ